MLNLESNKDKSFIFLPYIAILLIFAINIKSTFMVAHRAGSDGIISASSAGPGFDPRWGSKFSFENFQPRS